MDIHISAKVMCVFQVIKSTLSQNPINAIISNGVATDHYSLHHWADNFWAEAPLTLTHSLQCSIMHTPDAYFIPDAARQ